MLFLRNDINLKVFVCWQKSKSALASCDSFRWSAVIPYLFHFNLSDTENLRELLTLFILV